MWMVGIFKTILHMSFIGSVVIFFVIIARCMLRKAPKRYSYLLWSIVLFRLLCPVSFTSDWSLVPRAVVEYEEKGEQAEDFKNSPILNGFADVLEDGMPYLPEKESGAFPEEAVVTEQVVHMETQSSTEDMAASVVKESEPVTMEPVEILSVIWVLGIGGLAVYSVCSIRRLKRSLRCAVHFQENIYQCDYIETPFTLGILAPKIYLPTGLSPEETEYIVLHEKHHIRRMDHVIKVVAYVTLCLHWFNPLVWVSFLLAGKDMEMSCDEAVMALADEDIRGAYATSLLRLSTGRRGISLVPLAFGEGNVKARIKNVMNYKKPSFWVVIVSLAACICLGSLLIANPAPEDAGGSNDLGDDLTELVQGPGTEPGYGEQIREVTVWEKQVDYNGDGVEDSISFVMLADDSYEDFKGVTDGYELLRGPFSGTVKCVCGATGELNFESGNISHDRLGNRQISYAEKDGSHYMISTEIGEQMGSAYYSYEVYSLTEQELVDSYEIHFVTAGDDFRARPEDMYRQEVVPEFRARLEAWTKDGVLIAATDVNERVSDGIFVSSSEVTYEPSYYYDLVWNRVLDEKVRVDNYGLQVNLPKEEGWIQNPQYLLSDYPVAHIKYYDGRADAHVLLRYGGMEPVELAYLYDMEFDDNLQTVWYAGQGDERTEILCQVSHMASEEGKKTVLVSWTYGAMNYVVFGELKEDADETSLAETAVYVVENF